MKGTFPVQAMCEALAVSVSGFYQWRQRLEQPSARARADEQLREQIEAIHRASRQTYGSPRIHQELRQHGQRHSRKRVARIMRQHQIRGRCRGRFRPRTTDSRHDGPIAPNRLAGRAAPCRPDEVWVTDITYLPVAGGGWIYLAVMMDLCSRRIVGWCVSGSAKAELVVGALRMALLHRQPARGLIVHSDRGVQFASQAFRSVLEHNGLTASMSRKANCYDNAAMEAFFSSFKQELIYRCPPGSPAQTERAVFDYIETFYNPHRLHSSLGYVSPAQFEARCCQPDGQARVRAGDGAVWNPSEATFRSGFKTCEGAPARALADREPCNSNLISIDTTNLKN